MIARLFQENKTNVYVRYFCKDPEYFELLVQEQLAPEAVEAGAGRSWAAGKWTFFSHRPLLFLEKAPTTSPRFDTRCYPTILPT